MGIVTEKDPAITALLARLPLVDLGWVVIDHWPDDAHATGIARGDAPRALVYVSSHGKRPGRYDVSCELPTGPDPGDYVVTRWLEDVDHEALVQVLHQHLGMGGRGARPRGSHGE